MILGIIFREEYAAVRDAIRSDVVDAAKTIAGDVKNGSFPLPSLNLGANSKKLTGKGEQIDSSETNTPANTGEDLRFPAIMYPYRALLNEDAQAIYNQVYANALAKNAERFTLVQPVSESVLSDIMNAVYNDHPSLFWVDTAYSYGFIKSGSIVTVTLTFNDTMQNIAQAESAFNKTVDAIVASASQLSTDFEREKLVHDYLIEHTAYDINAPMNQSAYSALVSGESVCAGYARAFQHILMQLDIPCYYVTGTAAGGDHAWNIIALGSDYYNVDPSWDDAATAAYGSLNYSYFNVPDSQFSTDHKRSAISALLPACNGALMSYSAVYGDKQEKPAANTNSEESKLRTYSSLGFEKNNILTSLDEYNAYCRAELLRLGAGTHTLTMVLKNTTLMRRVSAAAENKDYIDDYAQEVVNELRLQNCRISLQLSFENLADGYILLNQTVKLSGESAPSATAAPTPAPTVAPSPTPTVPPTAIPATPPPAASESPLATVIPTEIPDFPSPINVPATPFDSDAGDAPPAEPQVNEPPQ